MDRYQTEIILQDRFLEEIEAHHRIIRKVCLVYARTKDDQDDLFQECLYNAWKAFPAFRNESKFSTWLYKLSLNTALYYQRKNKSSSTAVPFDLARSHEIEQTDDNQFELLYYAIMQLNPIEKSVILLYLEGLSYREIGEVTGFTETNTGVKLSRIKEKLKKIMTEDGL
jgi:RNA polymerase sigma factor (sigma-70 family)